MRGTFTSKKIMPGVWQINDCADGVNSSVNMYLVEGQYRSVLIDAGDTVADLLGLLDELTTKPMDVIITHGHGDHAANYSLFDNVYMPHEDIHILNNLFNMNIDKNKVNNLSGGEIFDLGDVKLEVISLPGHTTGSVVLLDRSRQLLFSSDGLGSGGLWMQFSHSTTLAEYYEVLVELKNTLSALDQLKIFVGHAGNDIRIYDVNYLNDIIFLVKSILEGSVVGTPTEDPDDFFGGYVASYGEMKELVYKKDRIR